MANKTLHTAKTQKKDEFYTQLSDIENELKHFREMFRGKVVYCNCDDPFESNFFRYFVLNFKLLGLKKLITTSYKPSPIANTQLGLFGDDITVAPSKGRPKITANKLVINEVGDINGDGAFNLNDIAEQLKANKHNEWTPLEGDGDFRSKECVELLKESDIVVTNPPFSLFREYVAQLVEYDKKFLIVGSKNAITYKEIFNLIQDDKMWLGKGFAGGNAYFRTPYDDNEAYAAGVYNPETGLVKFRNVGWFTNMDFEERHEDLQLYKKYKPEENPKYANYDAIEVSKTADIPMDYEGEMGVPITFLDRYNPEQFEIVGSSRTHSTPMSKIAAKGAYSQGGPRFYLDNGDGTYLRLYDRIVIKHKKVKD